MKRGALFKNAVVTLALLFAASILVVLETRILGRDPGAFWSILVAAAALGGYLWANSQLRPALTPLLARLAIRAGAAIGLWVASLVLAVVVGVNLKFALGGAL